EAAGTWRFVPPAAGGLRYALRVSDLAPFAPYLPLAADSIASGEVRAEGTISGPAERVRLAGTATGSDLRLDGWRAASLQAAYTATLGTRPPQFALDATARDLDVPGSGTYDTATVTFRQTPPLFSLAVDAERRGGGVLELTADGRILEGGRREAIVRRFVADVDADRWVLARPATVAWGGEAGLDVRGLLLVEQRGPGRLAVDGSAPRGRNAAFRVVVTAVPIRPILAATGADTTASGRLWLDARLDGMLETPIITADFRVERATIQG